MLRAKPSTVFNSSTVPYASTRRSAFEMRTPPAKPVCPPSPRVVAILIFLLLVFHGFIKSLREILSRIDCGRFAVAILIEFPRYRLMHINLRTQDFAFEVWTQPETALVWRTTEQYDLVCS